MIGCLPQSLTVNGRDIPINADFRNILRIFEAFADPELSKEEKAYVCIRRLYQEPITVDIVEEAIKKAFWFVDGGDMPKSKPEPVRTIDWQHDEQMLLPAVSKAMGVVDVRTLPYVHWWTFLGSFGEIGDGLLTQVLHIRHKLNKGKKLTPAEKEFVKSNKELIVIRTAEDKAAIAKTEAVLKKLI